MVCFAVVHIIVFIKECLFLIFLLGIDDCKPFPCSKYAKECKDGHRNFECVCFDKWIGANCTERMTKKNFHIIFSA